MRRNKTVIREAKLQYAIDKVKVVRDTLRQAKMTPQQRVSLEEELEVRKEALKLAKKEYRNKND